MADLQLPKSLADIIFRLGVEGVPVRVIARAMSYESEMVREYLQYALDSGVITEIPRDDWPPTAKRIDRLPFGVTLEQDINDITFGCQRTFKLTRLEAGLLCALLRRQEAEKLALHRVIEQQRLTRMSQPDSPEPTDPKMVDVIICKLRKKLKPWGIVIKTLWGKGYYMDSDNRKLTYEAINVPL
jgi:hypothetical protein